jgi:hypothetical protein
MFITNTATLKNIKNDWIFMSGYDFPKNDANFNDVNFINSKLPNIVPICCVAVCKNPTSSGFFIYFMHNASKAIS